MASPRNRDHLVGEVELLYSIKSKNRLKLLQLEYLAFSIEGTVENNILIKVDANICVEISCSVACDTVLKNWTI